MVSLDRPEAGDLGNRGRSVAQGGRIDIVEAGSRVPQGLPLWMRPMVHQEPRIGDEGAFDRSPFVRVLGLEVRADEHGGEEKHDEEIQQDFLAAGELERSLQWIM